MNLTTQVIIKFMRDLGLILSELEQRMGIDTTCDVLLRGVILDEKTPKLKYDGSLSVYKKEGLAEAIHNYLTRHIHNIPACNKYTIAQFHKDKLINVTRVQFFILAFLIFNQLIMKIRAELSKRSGEINPKS